MSTQRKMPRLIGVRLMAGTFAVVATLAVSADMLKGTEWEVGRAEWDRFVRAFWSPTALPPAPSIKPTTPKMEQAGVELALLLGGLRGLWWRLPAALVAGSKFADLKTSGDRLESLRSEQSGVRATRTVTVFERAVFGGGVIVTGHDFLPGALQSHRSFCYGEPADGRDGVRQWLTLAHRQGDSPVDFVAITTEQARVFKLDPPGLERLARSHCRFARGGL